MAEDVKGEYLGGEERDEEERNNRARAPIVDRQTANGEQLCRSEDLCEPP